jgi:hypothetical protein
MKRTQIVLVAVGLLALAGGGTALANKGNATANNPAAAGHGKHGPGDELDAAATYLGTNSTNLLTQLQAGKTLAQIAASTTGKSAAGLVAALVAAEKTEIATAVTAGRLTQAQADAIAPTLQQRFTDLVNGVRPARGPGGHVGPGPGLEAAATYLGISRQTLFTQLEGGKTLAQIADATPGKSASGLIAALVAEAKQHFGSNVPADLTQRITDLVHGVRPSGTPSHRGFRHARAHA